MKLEYPSIDDSDRPTAIQRFLAQFPEGSGAEAIHLALRALWARVEPDRVLACKLVWEVHTRGYGEPVAQRRRTSVRQRGELFRAVLGEEWSVGELQRMLDRGLEQMRGVNYCRRQFFERQPMPEATLMA